MKTILVVDDDRSLRLMLRETLEREGHRVLEAASAAEIFQILDTRRPDLILLDVHLGPDDGIAIGVGLRRERQYRGIGFAFMTGTRDQPDLTRMSRLLKARILEKPLDLAVLSELVAGAGAA